MLRAYFYLHFCVFVWGFTAILGKLISLQALPLVWWRVALCCLMLIFIIPKDQMRQLTRPMAIRMLGIGAMIGVHWICFYGAIKLSNASVAVATMAATSFFSAVTEPLLTKTPFRWYELMLGVLILPGMALIVENIDFSMQIGFAVGLLGAFLAAVFTAFNKKLVEELKPPSLPMSFMELAGGVLVCTVAMPLVAVWAPETRLLPSDADWFWLFLLSAGCTLLPFYLTLQAMRHVSAFAVNLTINLEPVYGVVLAALLFREDKELSPGFYVGVLIILVAVFSHPFLKKKFEK